jgi:Uma2 family endonuclease
MTATPAPTSHANAGWTYEDYRKMPEDGLRYEVIDGELFVSPSPTTTHQKVSKRLLLELMLQLERTGLAVVFDAPIDLIFGRTRCVVPDLLVVRAENEHLVTERGVECAPDIVVEILSPGTAKVDRGAKAELYASEGVGEYWLVDTTAPRVEVHVLDGAGYRLAHVFGPGDVLVAASFPFSTPIADLFA